MDAENLPENISKARFNEVLSRYEPLIKSISQDKTSETPGQPSLLELDEFRYKEATETLRSDNPKRKISHQDVKTLVNWKLRHGKFRSTLMKLVSSNDEAVLEKTIQEAVAEYWSDKDATKAMNAIKTLKGIGPATASLILSVHDPERVIFFSDEAFWWLCCGGRKSPIKYNAKEYQQLAELAVKMAKRLQVGATDIEMAAYVAMKDSPSESEPAPESRPKDDMRHRAPAKRKIASVTDTDVGPLRRSSRHKTS
ncbi:hypothetical protein GGR50DRAFT_317430 [Xylaria sp. CBS 124048]|nr:hypothetical protein GGR50DRAFT_317430 [Xylaria sp. CBS 124048]